MSARRTATCTPSARRAATELWAAATGTAYTGGIYFSSPALSTDGTAVYVGATDGNLYAFSTTNGALLWKFPTGGPIWSSPAIDTNGNIYIASFDGSLYSVNPADGSINWKYTTGASINSNPALSPDNTLVYVGSQDANFYAVNIADGSLKWKYTTGASIYGSPAVGADGTVFVGSNDTLLYSFKQTGGLAWKSNCLRSRTFSGLAISADGYLYAGTMDGALDIVMSNNGIFDLQKTATPSSPQPQDYITYSINCPLYGSAVDNMGITDVLPNTIAFDGNWNSTWGVEKFTYTPSNTNNWKQNTTYGKGTVVIPSLANFNYFCYTAQNTGTSGALEPVWSTQPYSIVNDGTITWQATPLTGGTLTWTYYGMGTGEQNLITFEVFPLWESDPMAGYGKAYSNTATLSCQGAPGAIEHQYLCAGFRCGAIGIYHGTAEKYRRRRLHDPAGAGGSGRCLRQRHHHGAG